MLAPIDGPVEAAKVSAGVNGAFAERIAFQRKHCGGGWTYRYPAFSNRRGLPL